MTMESFDLRGKKILLYGAASIGILSKGYFERAGFEIEGYIDQRSGEISTFLGKPVWGIDSAQLDDKKSDKYAVYVSVKNVFEHSKIANNLVACGFSNIIYRPLAAINGIGNARQNSLYCVYDYVEREEFDRIEKVPKTLEIDRIEARNTGLLEENENTVVCLVSIDLLHTDKKAGNTPWLDKPVMSELPHIDFFRLIAGEPGYSCDRYMQFCEDSALSTNQIAVTDGWRRNVIRNRSSVYAHMAESMEINSIFFQTNAANAIWDTDTGIFNLNSGKHRGAFFASKRRKYIPLRITKESYLDFINERAVKDLEIFFSRNGITEINYPIQHPYYYDYPCENREFYYNYLYKLMYEIAEKLYEDGGKLEFGNIKIYSGLHDFGFIERPLIKAGCKAIVDVMDNEKTQMSLLDNLCHSKVCNNLLMGNVNQIDYKSNFDYMLLDFRYYEINWPDKLIDDLQFNSCHIISSKEYIDELMNTYERFNPRIIFSSILFGKEAAVIELKSGGAYESCFTCRRYGHENIGTI